MKRSGLYKLVTVISYTQIPSKYINYVPYDNITNNEKYSSNRIKDKIFPRIIINY